MEAAGDSVASAPPAHSLSFCPGLASPGHGKPGRST